MNRHKNDPKRSPRGTGKPSGKDRTAHDAARGVAQLTLADLARQHPNSEEVLQLFDLMERESDRGSALVAGSLLEAAVEMAVACRMVANDAILETIFQGSNAPAQSFGAKTKLAYALGMFGPITRHRLELAREIRNTFAHALRPLDFKHPTLIAECEKLVAPPFFDNIPETVDARAKYIAFCRLAFDRIYAHSQKEGDKEITYTLP